MFNTIYKSYERGRRPIKFEDANNMNSKYVDFGGKKYTIFYSHDLKAVRCLGSSDFEEQIVNTLTVVAVDGCEVKPMTMTWNNDNENIIDNVKTLLTSYITSPEHQPTQEQIYEQWDGDLDRYVISTSRKKHVL